MERGCYGHFFERAKSVNTTVIKKGPAEFFRDMADRIERNTPEEFQGAFLILAPDGTVISASLFDPKPDEGAFWALIGSAVETAVNAFRQKEMLQGQRRF